MTKLTRASTSANLMADDYPQEGITCDCAHSMKRGITEYQAHDLATGERLFYVNLGDMTVNIGEFLAVVDSIKYIIEHDFPEKIIYTDSMTALAWVRNMKTASKKPCKELEKAEIFLKVNKYWVDQIQIIHWKTREWGEIPSDFGNK